MSAPRPLKVFLLAGEASGDRLGAALMRGLKSESARPLDFSGVGGAAMAAEGLSSLFRMEDIAVMGLAEVLPKLPVILARIRAAREALVAEKPDIVVTIDAPDFGLRVAAQARKRMGADAPLFVHYVAPSVWAWRAGRAKKLAGRTDHLLALLPFEPPYFHAVGLSCDFVGHPAAEPERQVARDAAALREEFELTPDRPAVVALPGSRRGEVEKLAPLFGETLGLLTKRRPDLAVLVPAAEGVADLVAEKAAGWPVETRVIDPRGLDFETAEARKRRAMAVADAALAASGTVSLELAAQRTPMVIGYRVSPISAAIAKRLLKVDTATLVNLIAGGLATGSPRPVPEFLQDRCRPELMAQALDALLTPGNPDREKQLAAEEATMAALGKGDAPPGVRAARSVLSALERRERGSSL